MTRKRGFRYGIPERKPMDTGILDMTHDEFWGKVEEQFQARADQLGRQHGGVKADMSLHQHPHAADLRRNLEI